MQVPVDITGDLGAFLFNLTVNGSIESGSASGTEKLYAWVSSDQKIRGDKIDVSQGHSHLKGAVAL